MPSGAHRWTHMIEEIRYVFLYLCKYLGKNKHSIIQHLIFIAFLSRLAQQDNGGINFNFYITHCSPKESPHPILHPQEVLLHNSGNQ